MRLDSLDLLVVAGYAAVIAALGFFRVRKAGTGRRGRRSSAASATCGLALLLTTCTGLWILMR
jgi:hypothetical protein